MKIEAYLTASEPFRRALRKSRGKRGAATASEVLAWLETAAERELGPGLTIRGNEQHPNRGGARKGSGRPPQVARPPGLPTIAETARRLAAADEDGASVAAWQERLRRAYANPAKAPARDVDALVSAFGDDVAGVREWFDGA